MELKNKTSHKCNNIQGFGLVLHASSVNSWIFFQWLYVCAILAGFKIYFCFLQARKVTRMTSVIPMLQRNLNTHCIDIRGGVCFYFNLFIINKLFSFLDLCVRIKWKILIFQLLDKLFQCKNAVLQLTLFKNGVLEHCGETKVALFISVCLMQGILFLCKYLGE